MRLIFACGAMLLLATLAFSQQAPVLNYGPDYGPCLACGPAIPLVTTPSISLQSLPTTTGASNATEGLVAGAANSTISTIPAYSGASYAQPVWYGTPPFGEMAVSETGMGTELGAGYPNTLPNVFFPGLEQTTSTADAAAQAKSAKHATRTYTNQDIDQCNRLSGTVKYRGKTVHME